MNRSWVICHRLNHMGMAADDHVHAQVAQLLRDIGLGGVLGSLVLVAPVDKEHHGVSALLLHLSHALLQLTVEQIQMGIVEGIDQGRVGSLHGNEVKGLVPGGAVGLIGIAGQADADAIGLRDHKVGIPGVV